MASKGKVSHSERIYGDLTSRISRCEIEPGQMVFESELAEEYGVSKTPVREALHRLVNEGLVEKYARVGYMVTKIGIKDVLDGYRLRSLLEGEAAALAAENISARKLASLEGLLEEIKTSRGDDLMTANRTFHLTIAKASGNDRLARMIRILFDDLHRLFMFDPHLQFWSEEGIEAEARILQALRTRKPDVARKAMHEHIQAGVSRIMRLLDVVSA